jgi:hypothetical protein
LRIGENIFLQRFSTTQVILVLPGKGRKDRLRWLTSSGCATATGRTTCAGCCIIILIGDGVAVADVVEAMASYRPCRPALGIDIALEEIEKNKGILYDEDVVNACLLLFRNKKYKIV